MAKNSISKEQLKEYVHNALKMEVGVQHMKDMVSNIDLKISVLNRELKVVSERRWRVPVKPEPPVEPELWKHKKSKSWLLWIVVILVILLFIWLKTTRLTFMGPLLALPILIGLPILIFWMSSVKSEQREDRMEVDRRNRELNEQYHLEVQVYPQKLKAYETECQNYDAACRNDQISKQNLSAGITQLQSIKAEVQEKINQAKAYISKFYSVGIIHPKYQGYSPMLKFYEYFDTGKCDTLKEAMIMYDTDGFRETVNDKLDNITDAVYSVQSELYSLHDTVRYGIEDISRSFDTTKGCLDIMNGRLSTQEYYAKISSECNRQIAADINTIKFYEDIKWIKGI